MNLVLEARHFQFRVEVSFKEIISSLKDHEKANKMVERNRILNKVNEYIDKELDPTKVNFYHRTKENFVKTKSITQILQELERTRNVRSRLSECTVSFK